MYTRAWTWRVGVCFLLLCLLSACATTQLPPLGSAAPPQRLARDEARLWEMSAKRTAKAGQEWPHLRRSAP
ncbi:MAG: hypothetical protein KatS3mg131_2427 [Candidatus Tectimicrobiota bacterium]|nr:MAG: hypothetical protein KatS3mg131_2427 [Candidatus Tectomicrobia bacterium]